MTGGEETSSRNEHLVTDFVPASYELVQPDTKFKTDMATELVITAKIVNHLKGQLLVET